MRQPARGRATRSQEGVLETVPAPVGGWNARDSIADMKPYDAIILDNFFPTPADVMLRKGREEHVTGISGQVESLMPYSTADGTETLFAAAGAALYDVTTAGAVGSAVQSGLTNARWQYVNFATTGGAFLQCYNGADKIRLWDGSTWEAQDGTSTHAITGITTSDVINGTVHKNRIWLVKKNSLSAYYLPTDAIAGVATAFPLTGVAKKGGYIVALDTWTLDAGDGSDDHWVAVTSEGQVIVYKGTDPASSTTWGLVGVWNLGAPIGRRSLLKWAGDLLIVTKEGVFPLAKALVSAQVDPKVALTDKIVGAMKDAAQIYSDNFGWQMLHYPGDSMLILNVPTSEGSGQHQYVMNTITGAWCRFKDWEANCWALFQGEPYFGGDGVVCKVWGVYDDDATNINGDAKTAFNYFKMGRRKKQWTMARPILKANGSPAVLIGLNVDYEDSEPVSTLAFAATTYGLWDTALWDSGVWGGDLAVLRAWQSVSGLGITAATRLKVASKGIQVRWQATDYIYKPASIGP